MRKIWIVALLVIFSAIMIAGCSSGKTSSTVTSSNSSSSSPAAVADGKTLLETRCTTCHTLAKVVNTTGTAAQWQQVVDQMVQRGAVLSPDEKTVLVQYLAANFK